MKRFVLKFSEGEFWGWLKSPTGIASSAATLGFMGFNIADSYKQYKDNLEKWKAARQNIADQTAKNERQYGAEYIAGMQTVSNDATQYNIASKDKEQFWQSKSGQDTQIMMQNKSIYEQNKDKLNTALTQLELQKPTFSWGKAAMGSVANAMGMIDAGLGLYKGFLAEPGEYKGISGAVDNIKDSLYDSEEEKELFKAGLLKNKDQPNITMNFNPAFWWGNTPSIG